MQASILDIIRQRSSVRTYSDKPIGEQTYEMIREFLREPNHSTGPLGHKVAVHIVQGSKIQGERIGTYGSIKNPQAFLAGIVRNEHEALVDYGYVMERLALLLTEQGLGTCWLGGFTKGPLYRELRLEDDEIIPAVLSAGYAADKQRVYESLIRSMAKSQTRHPREQIFFQGGWETAMTVMDTGPYEVPLEMVRLAPSASNKQPWRVIRSEDGKRFHFYVRHSPGYAGNKMGFDIQRLDVGIALCHFELACRETGIQGTWAVADPKLEQTEEPAYIITWHEGQ